MRVNASGSPAGSCRRTCGGRLKLAEVLPLLYLRGLSKHALFDQREHPGAAVPAGGAVLPSGPLAFPTARGMQLKDMALSGLLKELGLAAVPHGFRSSFRDWAEEETDHPRAVVEAALAHTVRNPVEAAYARSDLFERRQRLMNDWAGYLAGRARKREVARAAARPAVSPPPAAATAW